MKRTAFCVAILLFGGLQSGWCPAEPPPQVVYLNQAREWHVGPGKMQWVHVLARELTRQAFLMAARDEMGLATRDFWLGDITPNEGDNAPCDITAKPSNRLVIEVTRGFGQNQAAIARYDRQVADPFDYLTWTQEMEALSRTKFLGALKKAGFRGQANARNEKAAVPESVEELLGQMELISQFRALGELHEIMHSQGESLALLGALVRGYANLGVMTEYFWHPAHKVFKARALLYAQRMVARDEDSPDAKWHRAYAAALTGLHAWALADLGEADASAHDMAENDRPAQPVWAQLVGPFCRYEIDALDKHTGDAKIGQLAAMLKYLAVEQAGSQPWAVQTATDILPLIPECYRVHDGLCEFAGVAAKHSATLVPVQLVGKKLYGRLAAMSGLPEDIDQIVRDQDPGEAPEGDRIRDGHAGFTDEFKARGQLIGALLKTGEPPAAKGPATSHFREPSWAALGVILRELSFVQVYRRAHFERRQLDVAVNEWLDTAAPLVERHPCRAALDTFLSEAKKVKEAESQLVQIDVVGSDYPKTFFDVMGFDLDDRARGILLPNLLFNRDDVARDWITYIRSHASLNTDPGKHWLDILLKVSPYCPLARAMLIAFHWDEVHVQAVQWETESAPFPPLMVALAARYKNLGRWDDAEHCLKAAIKIVPSDLSLYRQLAAIYQQQGHADRWLETLQEYLNQRDFGLEHYQVQSEIAYHFTFQKQWEKAMPYAEGAAECYSAWGLLCAAHCCEGLQRWSDAEGYQRACSERYRGSSLGWYFFCRRTGKGNLKEARAFARDYVDKLADRAVPANSWDLLLFYLLEEQPEKALVEIEKLVAQRPVANNALWMALIADQLKDEKKRDAALDQAKVLSEKGSNNPDTVLNGVVTLVAAFVKDLAQGGKGQIDFDAVDTVGVTLGGPDRFMFHYALAQYLNLHGQPDAAQRYALRCMAHPEIDARYRTLAGAMLVQQGVKPAKYKVLLQPDADEATK